MRTKTSVRSSRWVPNATGLTAFLSGASLGGMARALEILKSRGVILRGADGPGAFVVIAAYFYVTVLVFVIGVRNVFPHELRTRIPFFYFPTDRGGWMVLVRCWGRMLLWFVGAGTAIVLASLVEAS